MLSTDDRRTLREIIIVRAAEEHEDEQLLERLEDPDELKAWLERKLAMESLSASSIAYARDDTIFEQDVDELADALGFDGALLKVLISEASDEVLAHAVSKTLAQDMACEACAEFASKSPKNAAQLRSLGLAVLAHVYIPAPAQAEDELTEELMRVWSQLNRPSRLRVLADAIDEHRVSAGRQIVDDDFVHQWYYVHLTAPMREAVACLMEHGGAIGGVHIIKAVPALAGGPAGASPAQMTQRLANMFRAAHARAVEAIGSEARDFVPVITSSQRGRGLVLSVPPRWKEPLTALLEIDRP